MFKRGYVMAESTKCILRMQHTSHGHSAAGRHGKASPEYMSWMSMIARCERPTCNRYNNYGGAGIYVCDKWRRSFEAFLSDMGPRPHGHTIDRVDSDGNYEPNNCRWASPSQQGRNRRTNVNLTLGNETKCQAEWASLLGLNEATLGWRIRNGWTHERALTTPTDRRFSRCA